MGIEDTIISGLDRRKVFGGIEGENEEEARAFNEKIIRAWDRMRSHPDLHFRQVTTQEERNRDEAFVKRIKNSPEYQKEKSDEALSLEYSLMEGIHNTGWLGEGVNVIPASEFDDVARGVDFVVALPGRKKENIATWGLTLLLQNHSVLFIVNLVKQRID